MGKMQAIIVAATLAAAPVQAGDWSGFYGGVELGYATSEISSPGNGNGFAYGGYLGYDRDFGSLVLGGEFEVMTTGLEYGGYPGTGIGPIYNTKLRFGFDAGNALIYGTGGYSYATLDGGIISRSGGGFVVGVGAEYALRPQIGIGAEYLYHDHSISGVDTTTHTINARLSYRF